MRHKDVNWNLPDKIDSTWNYIYLSMLMDIRDELKKLNRVFECKRFLDVPTHLSEIALNTKKVVKKKKV